MAILCTVLLSFSSVIEHHLGKFNPLGISGEGDYFFAHVLSVKAINALMLFFLVGGIILYIMGFFKKTNH